MDRFVPKNRPRVCHLHTHTQRTHLLEAFGIPNAKKPIFIKFVYAFAARTSYIVAHICRKIVLLRQMSAHIWRPSIHSNQRAGVCAALRIARVGESTVVNILRMFSMLLQHLDSSPGPQTEAEANRDAQHTTGENVSLETPVPLSAQRSFACSLAPN